jgi:hypothetical protein
MCFQGVKFSWNIQFDRRLPITLGQRIFFSPRRSGAAPRAVHVGFVVDKVALGRVFLRVLRVSHVSIIPPLLHIHSRIIWGWTMGPIAAAVPQSHSLTPS